MEVLREGDKTQDEDCGSSITNKVISLCNNSQNIEEGTQFNPQTKLLPPLNEPFKSLSVQELAFFDKLDPGYPQAYNVNKKSQ